MAEIELIGVPFDGYGRPGNQARAAGALLDAGLLDAFEHHHVAGQCDLDLPVGDPSRGPTSLVNERALLAMTRALNRIEAHSENTYMVGDRMDTDVVAGIEAGLETILVLTGSTARDEVERYPFRPSRILPSIAEAIELV